ncbi:recombinase family protein [Hyphomicrobium sp.]|uniref:recombinase family protein n=1 Tax=Hyphomicrobium sp. TaxID=82 RepID=UPI0025BB705B|nr:recombinase family protein [Hyphomicrobium sp.]MCC7252095.1 recombinase family protein [Hyphomicrobium sp.]
MRKADHRSSSTVHCAIYTRKSSDEGLEQEFNSLDAQREACEAYVTSQRHAGWVVVPDMYDDGGLSGGTMERPALQRLLNDIKAGKVQIVVVYKVDRLTRSLADFAKIVDVLDGHNASFVSVTQQFNTTTSMGRLTLNMLLSFAQFEREIAGERIRDKIAASKAKGMWMGGNVPLGYDVKDRKLIVSGTEADTVRLIFRRYAELGSVALLRAELDRNGIMSKRREGAGGRLSGGQPFSRGALYTLLQNRIYRGEIAHQGNVYPGQHEAIVDRDLWQLVQDKLTANRQERSLGVGAEAPSLFAGLIVDAHGCRMTPTHANKRGKRYRYYISTSLLEGTRPAAQGGMRIPAGEVEGLVMDQLRAFLSSRCEVSDAIAPFEFDAQSLNLVLRRASELAQSWLTHPPVDLREFIKAVVQQVAVAEDRIIVRIDRGMLAERLGASRSAGWQDVNSLALSFAASLRRAGKGMRIVVETGARSEVQAGLVSLLRDAFSFRTALLAGSDDSIESMTQRLGTGKGHVSALVRLSYLAPDIVRDCLEGRQPIDLSPTRLLKLGKDLPLDWTEQRTHLGFVV